MEKTIPEIVCESCNFVMKKTSWSNHIKTKRHQSNEKKKNSIF